MVTQGRLMDHSQLLSNCLPWALLAFPFLVLQKPCKKVPEARLPFPFRPWAGGHFWLWSFWGLETWEFLDDWFHYWSWDPYIFLLASSGNLCLFLGSVLFSVNTQAEYSFNFFFFFASSGSKFPLPFLWTLVLYVNVLFVSMSYIIYLVFILHLCLSYFLHCLDFPLK